jgi:flagellar M-ring protein FliF
MKPSRVSVVDEAGRLLADGNADEVAGGNADERKIAFERRMREQVESIVTSVVGPGRARVQLTADFDFNRITQTFDKFDPDSRVVRSSQTREEMSGAAADGNAGAVSVGNELPGANRPADAAAAAQRDSNRKSEEIVNYEISRTTKTEVIEGGRVNRISVAVVVDGNYTKNDKGELAYEPRPKEEIDRITALVRTAIGFDAKRGDQVEVANLRLAEVPAAPISEPAGFMSMFQFTKDDLMRGIELFVMALLGLIALMLGVRPLVRKVLNGEPGAAAGHASAGAVAGAGAAAVAAAPAAAKIPPPTPAEAAAQLPNRTSEMIEIAQVQGAVHAQSVQKVGELADNNPNETVAIVRAWLHEQAA